MNPLRLHKKSTLTPTTANLPLLARFTLLVFVVFGTSSCSFIERNTIDLFTEKPKNPKRPRFHSKKPAEELAKVDVEPLPVEKEVKTGVELVWKIPADPVEGFVIYYGQEREDLDKSIKLDAPDIEKYEDETHGYVYHHVLEDVPQEESVYVAIAAYRSGEESQRTEVFKVPGKRDTEEES